jgi:two-component sensor histidine kinase
MHLDSSVRKNDFSQQKYNALRSLFNLHEYKPGVFFATNRAQGLMKITRTKDSLDIQHYLMDRCPNLLYDSIHNKYWLYNKEKLILYDPENGNHLTMPAVLLKKLQIHSISKIQYDQYHNIYILTDRQIVILNTCTNELRYIKANVDLANAFMAIHDNVLLIAGKFGIGYSLIEGPLAVTRFDVIHNIKGHYYNRISGFVITANRNIVVATDKGTYSFRISDLLTATTKAYAKKADIMQLVISYPEQYAVHPSDTFYLPQESEKINFDFINFYGNGTREYTYKIEGRPQWQTTEAGEVFVGDVKPGKYYNMQCFVKDEIWKSNTYAFYLYRLPYWYQTPTWRIVFWISGAFLFLVLVAAIILLTKNIVARANEKKRLLTELELRAIHAQINPHFIFNTLGSALYFISKKKMDEAYLHVNKFSKLLRSYLRSSRNRYIALSDEIEMLRNYIELQQIRFESKFDYIIDVENKIAANSVQIPSLLLQPLVENAINHGLFHLPEGKKGLLSIRFYQGTSSNELICTIDDNGVGRQKAKEIKRNSDAQYESVGTKLTEELINIFKQYENMNIYLEYIDKPEPETGTIVKLTIRNLKYVA